MSSFLLLAHQVWQLRLGVHRPLFLEPRLRKWAGSLLRHLAEEQGKRTAVDVSAYFWHFLDAIWIFLMALFFFWG